MGKQALEEKKTQEDKLARPPARTEWTHTNAMDRALDPIKLLANKAKWRMGVNLG